jgi:hypothetical protein
MEDFMSDLVTLASQFYGVKTTQIVGLKEYGDNVVVLVDRGIAGTPKYTVTKTALLDLIPPETAQAEALEFDATKGAVALAKREGVDLSQLYQGERLTIKDVRQHLEGGIE